MKAEGTFGETKWIDNSTDTDNWLWYVSLT
jgi:hypothetical protein